MHRIQPRYEAVSLRQEIVEGAPDVIAVGVGADGDQRQIARLADVRAAWGFADPSPTA